MCSTFVFDLKISNEIRDEERYQKRIDHFFENFVSKNEDGTNVCSFEIENCREVGRKV